MVRLFFQFAIFLPLFQFISTLGNAGENSKVDPRVQIAIDKLKAGIPESVTIDNSLALVKLLRQRVQKSPTTLQADLGVLLKLMKSVSNTECFATYELEASSNRAAKKWLKKHGGLDQKLEIGTNMAAVCVVDVLEREVVWTQIFEKKKRERAAKEFKRKQNLVNKIMAATKDKNPLTLKLNNGNTLYFKDIRTRRNAKDLMLFPLAAEKLICEIDSGEAIPVPLYNVKKIIDASDNEFIPEWSSKGKIVLKKIEAKTVSVRPKIMIGGDDKSQKDAKIVKALEKKKKLAPKNINKAKSIYILRDGREIHVKSVIKNGENYYIKSVKNESITVKKNDVVKIKTSGK